MSMKFFKKIGKVPPQRNANDVSPGLQEQAIGYGACPKCGKAHADSSRTRGDDGFTTCGNCNEKTSNKEWPDVPMDGSAILNFKNVASGTVLDGGHSLNDIQGRIVAALKNVSVLSQPNAVGFYPYVSDVIVPAHEDGETWKAVVNGPGVDSLFCVEFTIGDDDVKIDGDLKKIERVTDYEFVNRIESLVKAEQAAKVANVAYDEAKASGSFEDLNNAVAAFSNALVEYRKAVVGVDDHKRRKVR